MNDILQLSDPDAMDAGIAGGKGAGLARLSQLGMNVPETLIVTDQGCRNIHVAEAQINAFLRLNDGYTFAVRSSALDEDGTAHSFAGQHDSYLDTPAADVISKIKECYQSFFSARALKYREQKNLPAPSGGAVIIQRMVQPHISGIAFSIDPAWQDSAKTVIEYAEGSGEQIASGDITPHMAHVDKITYKISADIESDTIKDMLKSVTDICSSCEEEWETPVDIEFCMTEDGTIYTLQCRPITGL